MLRDFHVVSVAALLLGVLLGGCTPEMGGSSGEQALTSIEILEQELRDPQATSDERISRIAAEGRPGNKGAVLPLLRVMKDRSQINFLPRRDQSAETGYVAVEFKEVNEKDPNALERTMAICALETIGSPVAIPDLVAALGDRSAYVRNHAARALLRFGIRAGLPVLLDNLDGRAESNETANRILKKVSGQDFGFHPDRGWKARTEAAARWRSWWTEFSRSGELLVGEKRPYNIKNDSEADLRISFFVDVMGQFQKKYSEEARTIMSKMGVVGIPFLRAATDQARAAGRHPLAAAVATVLGAIDDPRCEGRVRADLVDLLGYEGQGAVRGRAAHAIVSHPGPGVAAALGNSLSDQDLEVQVEALAALGRLDADEARSILSSFDPKGDRDLADTLTIARFESSGGVSGRDVVMTWLVEGPVDRRNSAYQVLVRVTQTTVPITPESSHAELLRIASTFGEKLPR